jgi:hypothetical protein
MWMSVEETKMKIIILFLISFLLFGCVIGVSPRDSNNLSIEYSSNFVLLGGYIRGCSSKYIYQKFNNRLEIAGIVRSQNDKITQRLGKSSLRMLAYTDDVTDGLSGELFNLKINSYFNLMILSFKNSPVNTTRSLFIDIYDEYNHELYHECINLLYRK